MREGHPDAARKKLSLERFCASDHVLVSYSGGALAGVTDEALAKVNRKRRVTVSVTSFLVLPDILRTSDLIAVVPSRLAEKAPGLKVFAPPIAISGFTKTLVWHERTHRAAAHRWARALLIATYDALV